MSLSQSQLLPVGFNGISDVTNLRVTIERQAARFSGQGNLPFKLVCHGQNVDKKIFVMAFNACRNTHGTADTLKNELQMLKKQAGVDTFDGLAVEFENLTVERGDSRFNSQSEEEDVDPELCVFYFELTAQSRVRLMNKDEEFSDLSRWLASDVVDLKKVFVEEVTKELHPTATLTEAFLVRLVLRDNETNKSVKAKTYAWTEDKAERAFKELKKLKEKSVDIWNITREGAKIQLRWNAVLDVYGDDPEKAPLQRIEMMDFGFSDVANY